MIFSYNWLQSFFKKKLPTPETLAELLTMHSFEVEGVKRIGDDFVLDIDVLPNRAPDCFSHLGIVREIAAITDSKYIGDTYVNLVLKEDKKLKAKDFVTVEVKNRQACPRYTVRVITDVKVDFSPKWMQKRLKVCGLRPINNIVDIANYVMLETGQPLHAFDGEKLEGPEGKPSASYGVNKKIIVRFAKKRERIVTLDEEKYDLDEDILVIADGKKPVAIAGIKGGKIPEIDSKTKVVVLESANFNQQVIRKGSRKLKLRTDASLRFEHGIDPNLTEFAINRAAQLIQEATGGKIAQGLIDVYPKKVLPKTIRLDLDYVGSLLGIKIPQKEIIRILNSLGLKIEKQPSGESLALLGPGKLKILNVGIPTFRLDLSLPEDLAEEVGRIYGYEEINPVFPMVSLIPPKRNLKIFWEDITKNILKEAGFTEVYNYSFISENVAKIFGKENLIELENPLSIEHKYLRPSSIPNLLQNVKINSKNFKEIKIFELGKIFFETKGIESKKQVSEKWMLTGVIVQKETAWVFYQLKGVVDLLLQKLGVSNVWYDQYQPTPEESKISIWHPKRRAEIKVNHKEVGFLGEISSRILQDLKIPMRVGVFDLDFELLSTLASEEHEYRPISRYPAAVRDVSILVPKETRVEEVLNKIEVAGGALVRDVDLFDFYEGEEIPEGKKNFAFHIIYQAEDRTLTAKEIDGIQDRITKALEEEPEWQVRR